MDRTNLLYNGDFALGTKSWNGSNMSVSNGILTVTGALTQTQPNYLIPVANGRRYRLSYDIKFTNTGTSGSFYISLHTFDNNHIDIPHYNTIKPYGNDCNTTLAAEVKNGDTTVTITNSTNWPTTRTYQRIGICNSLAWGYNRATYSLGYNSISNNIISLKSAWAGGTFAAGTKVSEFEAGSNYYYPHTISHANLPTEWTSYSVEFNGGDPMRFSTQYFQFTTIATGFTYQIRNIRFECISDIQLNHWYDGTIDLTKEGILKSLEFNDIGMPIRYVRDTISGNTVNTGNHWNEFQVYNYVGENIAWGKALTYGSGTTQSGTVSNGYITDGKINSNYNSPSSGSNGWVKLDLGYIENIHKIKIWHYYPDGRTYYNNVTEVSTDGTNWITIYKGQKPETEAGNEIILTSANAQLLKNGEVFANELIEL